MKAQELIALIEQMTKKNAYSDALQVINTTGISDEVSLKERATLLFYDGFCQFKLNNNDFALAKLSELKDSSDGFQSLDSTLQHHVHYLLGMLFLRKCDTAKAIKELNTIALLDLNCFTIIRARLLLAQTYLGLEPLQTNVIVQLSSKLHFTAQQVSFQIQRDLILWLATADAKHMQNALDLLNNTPFSSRESKLKVESYSRYINMLITQTKYQPREIAKLCNDMKNYIECLPSLQQLNYYFTLFQFQAHLASNNISHNENLVENNYLAQFPVHTNISPCATKNQSLSKCKNGLGIALNKKV